MANLMSWYLTDIPDEFVDIITRDVAKFDVEQKSSTVMDDNGSLDKVVRNSTNAWIPTAHWLGGWLWYYIDKVNRENFRYDLTDIDGGNIQYTQYAEGQYYNWHQDQDIDNFYKPQLIPGSGTNTAQDDAMVGGEYVRKLSFVLQLSHPDEYRGGELQFLDNSGSTFFAPKQRGTLILFDSRTRHRVRKVKSGLRKSLVGWVVGPRWR